MSTKTSADIHVNRSSTRIHRPPGGATTISFGDYDSAAPKQTTTPSVVDEPTVEAAPVANSEVDQLSDSLAQIEVTVGTKVGLAVAGEGSDNIIAAVSKALALDDLGDVVVSRVDDPHILPYITQQLLQSVDIVIAASLLTASTQSIANAIAGSLYEIGSRNGKAVIPGIISASSFLEAKALVSIYAVTWAKSVAALAHVHKSKAVITSPLPKPPAPLAAQFTTETDNVDVLLDTLRQSLKEHGARGIFGIGRKFRIADDDNNGQLEFSEFSKVIAEHALPWTAAQTRSVFDSFDKDKSGTISYEEFLVGLRGDLNDRRRQLVLLAFQVFDTDKSGMVEVTDLKGKYDTSKHPDVIAGRKSSDEVLSEFLDTFDSIDKDGKVTPAEFIHYYHSVSASIDDDDYFELMIRNAWHISGGEGWCANTSCRRVLVTHADGHQTVEEIKNDLGVSAGDHEALLANLASQGITDVVSIDVNGSAVASSTSALATAAAPAAANAAANAAVSTAKPAQPAQQQAAGGKPNNTYFSEHHVASRRRPAGGASSIVFG